MLSIEALVKVFSSQNKDLSNRVLAVDGVDLYIEEGELFTLLGPSGCGKTTTLRSVAGLEQPTEGRITVGDRVLFDSREAINVPVNSRGLGMVFQSYAIWPHMNVFKNVAYPLKVRRPGQPRLSKKDIYERVERVLAIMHLDHLMQRPSTDLSGGQQQRLALARALAMEPPLLLLDEPLSNLDAKLREQMRFELKRLQSDLGITAVYVTHDQVEALSMSSRIAVMNKGRVEQVGKPRAIYNAPSTRFVADFIGTSNFFDGVVVRREAPDGYLIAAEAGRLLVTSELDLPPGSEVIVSVRPENISPAGVEELPPTPGVWDAEVTARGFLGDSVEHELRVGELALTMRCNPEISFPPGQQVVIRLPQRWCTVIPSTDA